MPHMYSETVCSCSNVCVCICVHMHTCLQVYWMYLHGCAHGHMYMYMSMSAYMWGMCLGVCVDMHVCVHVCLHDMAGGGKGCRGCRCLSMYTTSGCMLNEVRKGPAHGKITQLGLIGLQAHYQDGGPGISDTRHPWFCPFSRASLGSWLSCLFFSKEMPGQWQQRL